MSRDEPVRVAAVVCQISEKPIIYRVRWEDDGSQEEVRLGKGVVCVARGTLRHQWLVDPTSLPEQFEADWAGMILRLIQESGRAITATQITSQLVDFGLDAKRASTGWASVRSTLVKNPDVEASGKGSGRAYRWIGRIKDRAEATVEVPQATGDSVGLSEEPTAPDEAILAEMASGEERLEPAEDHGVAEERAVVDQPPALIDVLARAFGEEAPQAVDSYVRQPLRTATRLGRLAPSELAELLRSLTDQNRTLAVALLLALPVRSEVIDSPEPLSLLDDSAIDGVLASAAVEACGDATDGEGVSAAELADADSASRTAASWLVRRAAGSASPLALAPLIELTAYIAGVKDPDLAALDVATSALGRLLPLLSPGARAAVDQTRLASAVAQVPLTVTGGRAALLVAVGKTWPDSIADRAWWSGVTLQEVVDCAIGRLGAVTSMPAVAEKVIRPLVIEGLSAVTTRTQLTFFLSLPREFAAQLPPAAVAAAFGRTAGQEPIVAGWLRALADDESRLALRRDLDRARADAAAAGERAEVAERGVRELVERCDRLEAMLRNEHAQAVTMRASQERQVRIDVIRALADLAAEVEEVAASQAGPGVLVGRVRGLVAGQALEPIGAANAEVAFDPAVHEAVHEPPEIGARVQVIRPGYRWWSASEEILIHKTVVTSI